MRLPERLRRPWRARSRAERLDLEGARLDEQERRDAVNRILVMARGGDPTGDQPLGIARPAGRPGSAVPT